MSLLRNKTRREKRQLEAGQRQQYWNGLDTRTKLEDLDKRLGKGKGAIKQREKLTYLLSKDI